MVHLRPVVMSGGDRAAIVCRNVAGEGKGSLVLIGIAMKFDSINEPLKTSWKIHCQATERNAISD